MLIRFCVSSATDAATYGESYDYNSLLHGSNYLFAVNRTEKTITARNGRFSLFKVRKALKMESKEKQIKLIVLFTNCPELVKTQTRTCLWANEMDSVKPIFAV